MCDYLLNVFTLKLRCNDVRTINKLLELEIKLTGIENIELQKI